jgi:threonine dehydrogenase-like Zn-dependent dehydrogenase
MKALFCKNGELSLDDIPVPVRKNGEILIRVHHAGICSTDLEILKGYVPGFNGVLGHEFFGFIEEADDAALIGKRATAEINFGCGDCGFCKIGLGRHCPDRTVLGIINRQGAFAEYLSVPAENVIQIPSTLSDSSAVLIEPLAAALEIFEQVSITEEHKVLLIGDGRLAQLIALAFSCKEYSLTAVGRHSEKLDLMAARGTTTCASDIFTPSPFDIVIEASGSPSGFQLGLLCVKPRGTMVLKSTHAAGFQFNPAPLVVNEITVVGSRCGRFEEAVRFLINFHPDLSYMISAKYPFSQAPWAFARAKQKNALKVILEMDSRSPQFT